MFNVYCPGGNMYPPYSPLNLIGLILFSVGILYGGYFLMNLLIMPHDKISLKKKIVGVLFIVFIVVGFMLNLAMWNGNGVPAP